MANKITGHELRLTWNDFAGRAPANPGTSVAFTSASFSISAFRIVQAYSAIKIKVPDAKNDLGYVIDGLTITVSLNRNVMWSVASAQNANLLKHEQGHYDIVALVMQDLFTDVQSPPNVLATPTAVQTYFDGLVKEARRRIDAMESTAQRDGLYDAQTGHGLTTAGQTKWNQAFDGARPPVGMRFDLSLSANGITV